MARPRKGRSRKRRYATPVRVEVILGRHPDTDVLHRLTLEADGSLLIERGRYEFFQRSRYNSAEIITDHRPAPEPMIALQEDHQWLIDTIRRNRHEPGLYRRRLASGPLKRGVLRERHPRVAERVRRKRLNAKMAAHQTTLTLELNL